MIIIEKVHRTIVDVLGQIIKSTNMEDVKKLDLTTLYDLLALNTASYTQMLTQGGVNEQFNVIKQNILDIQRELDNRKSAFRNVTESDVDFFNQYYRWPHSILT